MSHIPHQHYFAYGSNMNPLRMQERGLWVLEQRPAWIDGHGLRFNKRSRRDAQLACANIVYAPNERIEGVLYRLGDINEIEKLDSHEGTPRMYSREIFPVCTEGGLKPAWTYVANPAVIDNAIKPARWYIKHLLAGSPYLSVAYCDYISATLCRDDVEVIW